jgi:hypothetical protein
MYLYLIIIIKRQNFSPLTLFWSGSFFLPSLSPTSIRLYMHAYVQAASAAILPSRLSPTSIRLYMHTYVQAASRRRNPGRPAWLVRACVRTHGGVKPSRPRTATAYSSRRYLVLMISGLACQLDQLQIYVDR